MGWGNRSGLALPYHCCTSFMRTASMSYVEPGGEGFRETELGISDRGDTSQDSTSSSCSRSSSADTSSGSMVPGFEAWCLRDILVGTRSAPCVEVQRRSQFKYFHFDLLSRVGNVLVDIWVFGYLSCAVPAVHYSGSKSGPEAPHHRRRSNCIESVCLPCIKEGSFAF